MSYFNRCLSAFVATVIMASAIVGAQTLDASKSANPELVGQLAQELQVTPQQAEGAAGALFETARGRMPASDWSKVSSAVPGMDGLLKAAPATGGGGAGGALGKMGGLANATAAFQKLGLKPEMVSKAVPILTQYVSKSGGASVASLLAGALK